MGAKEVRNLLNEYGFKYSKSKGQNFLVDENIPEKIVMESGIDKTCGVLEVGPGLGALTLELSRAAGCVTAVELDGRLMPILSDVLKGRQNVDIVQGDILKLDIKELLSGKMPGLKLHVCSNLPYNITTPAISAFIGAGIFLSITVMVQREVARRICAEPGAAEYGAFSVYANYYTEPRTLFEVSPECFMPQPGVWSAVVTMKSREERILQPEQEKAFFSVVRAAFGQRRKTLVNALHSAFGNAFSKEEIAAIVRKCGLDTRVRGETLDLEQFARLSLLFGTDGKKKVDESGKML